MVVPFLFAATRNRMFAGSVCVQLSLSHRSSYIWLGNPGLVDRRLDLASLETEKKVPAAAVKWIIKRHVLSLPCCFRPSEFVGSQLIFSPISRLMSLTLVLMPTRSLSNNPQFYFKQLNWPNKMRVPVGVQCQNVVIFTVLESNA